MKTLMPATALLITFHLLTGCASIGNPYIPTKNDWKQSASAAAENPASWLPVVGAIAIVATNSDGNLSNYASSHNPVFGSGENAEKFAKDGKTALEALAFGSVLITPQSQPKLNWFEEKGRNLVAAYAAQSFANGATGALKGWTDRERPNGRNNHSFPSGHASVAAASAAIIASNIDQFQLDPLPRVLLKTTAYAASTGVAWARVESQAHYPTDILVGLGLGNFISETIYDAFLHAGLANTQVAFIPMEGGALLTLHVGF
ncbi:MAG: phosphatase PAP2 family protein [Spongiibacteraceae bacterium]